MRQRYFTIWKKAFRGYVKRSDGSGVKLLNDRNEIAKLAKKLSEGSQQKTNSGEAFEGWK
jgi:hypothetical protein